MNIRQQFVEALAKRLGETETRAITQLTRITECMPADRILELVHRVERIEQRGGMIVRDGSRRRTKGGAFFHLARMRKYGKLTKVQRKYCFDTHLIREARIAA